MAKAPFPVVGSISGNRHVGTTSVLNGGHSMHPLQRAGQVAGPIAAVIPGAAPGSQGPGNGPPAGGPVSGYPPLLNLNPIGMMAATRVS